MSTTETRSFELPIAADRYLAEVFLDATFTEQLYREGLGFADYEVLEHRPGSGGALTRRLRLCPPMHNAPKVVQKVLGKTQEYEERGQLASGADAWRFEVIPATMAKRISVTGSQRAEPAGDGRCRVVVELKVKVSIMGVGGAIEKFMMGQFTDNIAKQRTFSERWLASR